MECAQVDLAGRITYACSSMLPDSHFKHPVNHIVWLLRRFTQGLCSCCVSLTGDSVRFCGSVCCIQTRVSPLKSQTIPGLELLSALLLARLLDSVSQSLSTELTLSLPQCFTNSTVTLCLIKGTDKCWKPFVQNRVAEIRTLVPSSQWKHCSGKDNPADIPSRGLSPLELSMSALWHNGPEWLVMSSVTDEEDSTIPLECLAELKCGNLNSAHGLLITEVDVVVGQIMKCEDFSSYCHLIAVTAVVLKFCRLLCSKIRPGVLDMMSDESKAEELWILEAQKSLVSHKSFKQWKTQFNLFGMTKEFGDAEGGFKMRLFGTIPSIQLC